MKLTDFRDQLAARAAESDRPQPDPLPVLRRRIRNTKRRRTAVAAAGASLAVALVATVVPGGLDLRGTDPAPAGPPRPPDVVKGAIRFPGAIGGDTLHKAVVGDIGQEFSFELTTPDGETEVRPVCELPGTKADIDKSTYWVQVLVNGRMRVTSPCGAGEGAKAGEQHWSRWVKRGDPGLNLKGMEPGRRATITVRVARGNPAVATPSPNRGAQIGVGIYGLGPMRVVERDLEGVRIPEVVDHQGRTYRLADVQTRWAEQGPAKWAKRDASVTVRTPAGAPFLVRYLTIGRDSDGYLPALGVRTLRMTGIDPPIIASQRYDPTARIPQALPRIDPVRVDARPASSVTVTLDGPDVPDASMLLAVYQQVR